MPDALIDRISLWFMRATIRFMSDAGVENARSDIARELAKFAGIDTPGTRFAARFLAVFDNEQARRAMRASQS